MVDVMVVKKDVEMVAPKVVQMVVESAVVKAAVKDFVLVGDSAVQLAGLKVQSWAGSTGAH